MKIKTGGGPKKISTKASRSELEDKPRKKYDADGNLIIRRKKKEKVEAEEVTSEERVEKAKKKLAKVAASVGTSMVISEGHGLKKSEKKAVNNFFGERSGAIMEMLEVGDSDGGIASLKKALLLTVIRVLPDAEAAMVDSKGQKGTYQFVTLISQIRELVSDIQADRDRAYIAQSLLETIIRPAFMDVAQTMLTTHHEFRKATEDYIVPKDAQIFSAALINMAKELASNMNVVYKDVSAKLVEALKT